jgi:hypothetical protein
MLMADFTSVTLFTRYSTLAFTPSGYSGTSVVQPCLLPMSMNPVVVSSTASSEQQVVFFSFGTISTVAISFSLSRARVKTQTYQYLHLNSHLKEIRLLHILPPDTIIASVRKLSVTTNTPKIRCQTIQTSLKHSPTFSALSYSWGSSKPNREIEVDGSHMYVSENLLTALLQFQADDSSSSKLFWADVVCVALSWMLVNVSSLAHETDLH